MLWGKFGVLNPMRGEKRALGNDGVVLYHTTALGVRAESVLAAYGKI